MTSRDNIRFFRPVIIDVFKNYTVKQFYKDVTAGVIVGIVALPLAIAFGIASGVSPEKGIVTAIIAGFIISALGGSRVQIGGPTGAFIVIVYGIVQQYGVNGLIIATFLAGLLLIIMGIARLGSVIKFIPFPVVVGFTSGIAVIIFSSEIKDLLGLQVGALPAGFIAKWNIYISNLSTVNISALAISCSAIIIILLWPKVTHKVPGSLVAILLTTLAVYYFHIPVETIGSRFGSISATIPRPALPHINWEIIQRLIAPAFTIALLGAIESLLSAVVADGMTGGNHQSNTELVAQGIANICSSVFGGIPATGAIARTATNIKNGGRTPVAGIIHALMLVLILLFIGKWAVLIPMATLAGILVVVAYHMSEWENFRAVLKSPKGDMAVLLTTFTLTVLVDLTVAIEIGVTLAVFLFMQKMIRSSNVTQAGNDVDKIAINGYDQFIAAGNIQVFEIKGPLFFGAAYKFRDAMKFIDSPPSILILRMKDVPVIDATGIKAIQEFHKTAKAKNTRLILSEISGNQVLEELRKARLLFAIGKANVTDSFPKAIERSKAILADKLNS